MPLLEQAAERVALAHKLGRAPLRWIASEAAAAELPAGDSLHGIPLLRGQTRWGLELVCAQ